MSRIETETPLIPAIGAAMVIEEARLLSKGLPVPDSWRDILCDRAEEYYKANEYFRRKLNSDSGNNHLLKLMRHWLAGEFYREYRVRLPQDFCNGLKVK